MAGRRSRPPSLTYKPLRTASGPGHPPSRPSPASGERAPEEPGDRLLNGDLGLARVRASFPASRRLRLHRRRRYSRIARLALSTALWTVLTLLVLACLLGLVLSQPR